MISVAVFIIMNVILVVTIIGIDLNLGANVKSLDSSVLDIFSRT